jgi:hypothetical protein
MANAWDKFMQGAGDTSLAKAMPTGEERIAALESETEAGRRENAWDLFMREGALKAAAKRRFPVGTPGAAEERATTEGGPLAALWRGGRIVQNLLDFSASPAYGTMGALRSTVAGRGPLAGIGPGITERTSSRDIVADLGLRNPALAKFVERHPYLTAGVTAAADIGIDPSNIVLGWAGRGAGEVGRGLLAAGERVPVLGRAVRVAKEGVEAGAAARELGHIERLAKVNIRTTSTKVSQNVERLTKDITRTQGVKVGAEEAAPRLSMDVAMARGEVKRAKATEAAAAKIGGRIEAQTKVRPRLPGAEPGPAAIPDVRAGDFREIRRERGRLARLAETIRTRDATPVAQPYVDLAARLESKADELSASPRLSQLAKRITREKAGHWNPQANGRQRALQAAYDEATSSIAEAKAAATSAKATAATVAKSGLDSRLTLPQIDEQLKVAAEKLEALSAKYETQVWAEATSEPLAVVKARPVIGRVTGARAAAQTKLGGLRQAVKAGGRVPIAQRGVAYPLLEPGEKVTEGHVRNLIGSLAERASPSGLALTPEDAEKEILGYAASLGLDTGKLTEAARQTRMLGEVYKRRIVDAGVKTWEELNRVERQGGYLRRLYGRHVSRDEYGQWLRDNGMGDVAERLDNAELNRAIVVSPGGKAPVRMWSPRQNIPVAAQKGLQPVTDVLARIQGQSSATERILPRMETFARAAENPVLASATRKEGWIQLTGQAAVDRADRLRAMGHADLADELMEQAKSGGWGKLTGMWVHPKLYYALNPQYVPVGGGLRNLVPNLIRFGQYLTSPVIEPNRPTAVGLGGLYYKAYGKTKSAATVWNPFSQGFNKVANWVQMHAFGGTPAAITPALDAVSHYDVMAQTPFFRAAVRHMAGVASEGALGDIRQTVQAVQDLEAGGSRATRATRWLKKTPGAVWQLNELTSKLGVTRWHMSRGMPLEQAASLADAAIYRYNDIPRWMGLLRSGAAGPFSWLAPFPTYAYKTAGQFSRALLTHPRRLNVYTRAVQALESLTPKEQREAEQAILPDYEQANLPVRLPVEDVQGRPAYWRSGRALPWGSFEDVRGRGTQDLTPGHGFMLGPLLGAIEGRDDRGYLLAPAGAPWGQQARARVSYAAQGLYSPLRLGVSVAERRMQERRLARLPPEKAAGRAKPRELWQLASRTYPLDVAARTTSAKKDFARQQGEIRNWVKQEEESRNLPFAKWPEKERAETLARMAKIEAREAELEKAYQTLLGFARSGAYRRRAARAR